MGLAVDLRGLFFLRLAPHIKIKGDIMPPIYMFIMIAVVIAAGGLTVAATQGLGAWVMIPALVAALGLRVYLARK